MDKKSKDIYPIGYWVENNKLFARVRLVYKSIKRDYLKDRRWFEIWVNFNEAYSKDQLIQTGFDINSNLPFYQKAGGTLWKLEYVTPKQLTPELNRLVGVGFVIKLDDDDSSDLISKLI